LWLLWGSSLGRWRFQEGRYPPQIQVVTQTAEAWAMKLPTTTTGFMCRPIYLSNITALARINTIVSTYEAGNNLAITGARYL